MQIFAGTNTKKSSGINAHTYKAINTNNIARINIVKHLKNNTFWNQK